MSHTPQDSASAVDYSDPVALAKAERCAALLGESAATELRAAIAEIRRLRSLLGEQSVPLVRNSEVIDEQSERQRGSGSARVRKIYFRSRLLRRRYFPVE
jgi:hypothetical protein